MTIAKLKNAADPVLIEGQELDRIAEATWAVVVSMILVFTATGVLIARAVRGPAMTVDLLHLFHQALFGALAACGFGILFNFGWRDLPWCAASGALALATRTLAQEAGWSLEAASFAAAVAVGCGAQLLHSRLGLGTNALAAAGCIPMVPGLFAAQGILGLYALTAPRPNDLAGTLVTSMEFTLRVIFTIGAIGTVLSIATYVLQSRDEGGLGEKR